MSALNLNLEYTTEAVLNLKAAYEQLPWYKRIFFPRRLGKALTQMSYAEPTHEQLLSVHTTNNHRINFIAKRIFTCLKVFSETLKLLKSTHLKEAIVENVPIQSVSEGATNSRLSQNSPAKTIHYAWIGPPTYKNEQMVPGHDLDGPIQLAQKLQNQPSGQVNPIKFWCLKT